MKYQLRWNQNMGGGRGTMLSVESEDYESALFIWSNLLRNATPDFVRNVTASVIKNPKLHETYFDPNQRWPREV